ncbi:4483_t:CDS:2 [Funneliformis caledonium]|uniref:4483_t:CDS:1 n=1 Tax=Funneliformis caledonium TaxID=1117310 RepID=A0A9N9FFS9_9GLOM|nr:4483_t:CDS:2 [Funneliformis caledonium]
MLKGKGTNETLVELDNKFVLATKMLDLFCQISNISGPRYELLNDGHALEQHYVADNLIEEERLKGEKFFSDPLEAQECVAEMTFDVLYSKAAHGTIFLENFLIKLVGAVSNIQLIKPQRIPENINNAQIAADNEVFQLLKGLQGVFRSVGFTIGPREAKFVDLSTFKGGDHMYMPC